MYRTIDIQVDKPSWPGIGKIPSFPAAFTAGTTSFDLNINVMLLMIGYLTTPTDAATRGVMAKLLRATGFETAAETIAAPFGKPQAMPPRKKVDKKHVEFLADRDQRAREELPGAPQDISFSVGANLAERLLSSCRGRSILVTSRFRK